MPRNPNEPPPLNPSPADVGKGGLREHLDNTNINNPSNPQEYKDIARLSGQNAGSDQGNTSGSSSNPTVTVTGDLSGSKQVTPGTQLMDVVSNIDSNFKDYKYERVDGSSVDLSFEVKGDVTIVAKSKSDSSKSGSEETKPPEEKSEEKPAGNTSQQGSSSQGNAQQRRS